MAAEASKLSALLAELPELEAQAADMVATRTRRADAVEHLAPLAAMQAELAAIQEQIPSLSAKLEDMPELQRALQRRQGEVEQYHQMQASVAQLSARARVLRAAAEEEARLRQAGAELGVVDVAAACAREHLRSLQEEHEEVQGLHGQVLSKAETGSACAWSWRSCAPAIPEFAAAEGRLLSAASDVQSQQARGEECSWRS
jgi:DNA repair exonuclease SbcCD ATPase subunit